MFRLYCFFLVFSTFLFPATINPLPVVGEPPSPRIDTTLTFDPSSGQIYAFGGQDQLGASNSLYAFATESRKWTKLSPIGTLPAPRFGQTTIFDNKRNRVILFGGQGQGFFNDTWAYEISSNRWVQLAPGEGPSRRYGHSAIYDTNQDRMIISHGFTDAGRFDDTWSLDLATNSWRNISPASGRPLKRCLHHAVLDSKRQQMLLYGGCSSGFGPCPQGDLWSFDLKTERWTELKPSLTPDPRQWYAAAFDESRERMIVWGGSGRSLLNDWWEYDPAVNQWAQIQVAGPEPRSRHQAVFVPQSGETYFFGGQLASGSYTNELYSLRPNGSPVPAFSRRGVTHVFGSTVTSVSPGMLLTIYGANLGDAKTQVLVNSEPAPVLFGSGTQVNFQIPFEISRFPTASIRVRYINQESEPVEIPVTPTSPSLYQGAFHADGLPIDTGNPARPGEIVIFYSTGHGVTSPAIPTGQLTASAGILPVAPLRLTVNNAAVQLLYNGLAPGTLGLIQLNAQLPPDLPVGDWPVQLTAGLEVSKETLLLPVRATP